MHRQKLLVIRSMRLFAIVVLLGGACDHVPPFDEQAHMVTAFTGARTRAVWVQDTGEELDFDAQGDRLVLKGFDSANSRGEYPILPQIANYARPLITRNGDRIVFSSRRDGKAYVVNWDGTGKRELCDGLGVSVWIDPVSKDEWVYVARPGVLTNEYGWPMGSIWRHPIDRPSHSELVWDLTHVDVDNFQISADGRYACGLLPWPTGGIARLPNVSFQKYASGCWTSLAPDNSYKVWVFDGSHRHLSLFDPGGKNKRVIPVSQLPGIDNHEVGHPRWTNHPRFMTMTGPYRSDDGGIQASTKGADVEIYIGRFNDRFDKIEESVRLTYNNRADYFPDIWIESGQIEIASAVGTESVSVSELSSEVEQRSTSWPGRTHGTIFLWENRKSANQIVATDGSFVRSCRAEPRGCAWYGRFYDMYLQGGMFVAPDVEQALLEGCRAIGQLSLEALITPAYLQQDGPAQIMSFGSNTLDSNFSLAQQEDMLVFRIHTDVEGQGKKLSFEVCRLPDTDPHHVLLSYWPGHVVGYLDGEVVFRSERIAAYLNRWTAGMLSFGNSADGGAPWIGRLEGVAIMNRFVDSAEALHRAQAFRRRLETRRAPSRLVVEAKLLATSSVPDPQSIAPYRRALVVYEYEIETVLSGRYEHEKMQIAHWAILDGEVIDGLPERIGVFYRLTVEPFDEHPQLESERLLTTMEGFDTPLFYDVGSSSCGAERLEAVAGTNLENH